jgi:hypothetical protein
MDKPHTMQTTALQNQILGLAKKLGLNPELRLHDPRRKAWVKDNVNGVKFEIEHYDGQFRLIVAYNNKEIASVIREEFDEADKRVSAAFFYAKHEDDFLSIATRVKDFILSEGLAGENRRIKQRTTDEGYFEKTAQIIELAVKLEHWDVLERGGLGFDAHDGLITIGKSKAMTENPNQPAWREHLVPCCMIKDKAIEMVKSSCSIAKIAQMLKENLAIMIISQEEQKIVDADFQTTMPKGWEWGDSVFARLDETGILY